MAPEKESVKVVASNRKARHKYAIGDTFEAGLELRGAEVKSLREGQCSIDESYARPLGSEIYIFGMHVPPYKQATVDRPDPMRRRKVLMHRREIDKLSALCSQRGYTLVPLKVYFKAGWAKVVLGLARAKKIGDKREKKLEEQRKKETASEMERRKRR